MNNWIFYLRAEEAWVAMLESIRGATRSIELESYIFEDDSLGTQFRDALIERSKAGVKVRLLLDMTGSYSMYGTSFVTQMQEAGIEVLFYNPIRPWRVHAFGEWILRDHRKILIIDSEIGYTGGVNIQEAMRGWRDTHVRVEGPLVEQLSTIYEHMRRFAITRKWTQFPRFTYLEGESSVLTNSPHRRARETHRAYIQHIREATRSIFLTTPYFIPDRRFYRSLCVAARRGVDVRLIVPRVSDHPIISAATKSMYAKLLESRGKIYEYGPEMIHTKSALVDESWGLVGSTNLDHISFLYNYQSDVQSSEPSVLEALKAHFITDLSKSKQVNLEEWKNRPWSQKLKEALTRPLHFVL